MELKLSVNSRVFLSLSEGWDKRTPFLFTRLRRCPSGGRFRAEVPTKVDFYLPRNHLSSEIVIAFTPAGSLSRVLIPSRVGGCTPPVAMTVGDGRDAASEGAVAGWERGLGDRPRPSRVRRARCHFSFAVSAAD